MNFYDKIKQFLGFSEPGESPEFYNQDRTRYWSQQQPRDDETREDFDSPFHNGPRTHFNVFTDPLEMHRYFEEQMEEMMKSFSFFGDGFSQFFNIPQIEDFPARQEEEHITESGDLRKQFLKPGFEKPSGPQQKKDEDIDGQLDIRDWGSVLGEVTPKSFSFSQSVTSKTVTKPDGSVEIHRTIRDNKGNEETVITRRLGDKEYTITKKRDKDGKEEIVKTLVNLDEKEVNTFLPQDKNPELNNKPSWPFFDRFFK